MKIYDKILFLIGIFLAGAMDMALGNFIAHCMIKFFGPVEHVMFTYIFAIAFALLPDIDALLQRVSHGKILSNHRNWPHWPLLILPIIFFTINIFSFFYAVLACLCLFIHYIHDSVDLQENGGGIEWLAPFSDSQYQISIKRIKTEKLIVEFPKEKIEKIKKKKETMYRWLKKYYLKITENSLLGILALITSLIINIIW
ncbi:hypothetical protein A2331_01335 [Candidatus Falkowbacteria bacterium RIFOXYB2_FULL_34_18]|uniref:Metal-dependent hydrolase n=1 Tax=Candidatus Falkowbacteria bacterium RIFOXYD2_FULL_34_120 TaxID=1798007 RepID=A0A1F5TQ00_9BACT|nr:MAG: hypothetical protein A2331_01335 [Candidatus Falkowbacteria bacterium RIFOXYB2_FULL_34_18]OGF29260.1 MAG: hypothetical protein A2500_05215 [Candidatus Falkowbacteria bacterium RIFOXYC12_FULL_34_55]OGF36376.1 MAG: hypothetical protein A2466_00875 [Candidatus Falkowbacteria bacterium RIFOXYC2_FULL_34_220]OGF38855.1 MAG: hypothetical protein A2515_05635 [Candidatus Falkowbacteria bacterium RIFOXYD12_FULL_34_57]OGF40874.1 MAG: hypothetical protein A2531_03860 [Candidatus Falkowbacteria bact